VSIQSFIAKLEAVQQNISLSQLSYMLSIVQLINKFGLRLTFELYKTAKSKSLYKKGLKFNLS